MCVIMQAKALTQFGSNVVVTGLIETLKDSSYYVCKNAIETLGRFDEFRYNSNIIKLIDILDNSNVFLCNNTKKHF